ncbi:MAG: right-handed parallel beta-helix repeat-containing protein [Planctomycetes bacterium]|nr:right-handed parallel beta-helix repeat-containing protein [Planctomycetota bacterium]
MLVGRKTVVLFLAVVVLCGWSWGATFRVGPAVVVQDEEFEKIANSLGPGDELILAGGVYSQSGRRAVTVKGTAEAPIVIRAADGADPVLTRPADDIDRHNNIEFVDCSYLAVRGIHFEGGSSGVRFIRGRHVTFENCEISRTGNNALTMNSGNCDSFVIRANHIHHTGLSTRGPTEGEGMYIGAHDGRYVTTNTLIEGNYIHHLRGTSGGGNDGIEIKFGSWGNTIRDNVIHDTNIGRQYPGIFVYGGGKGVNVVEGNVIWRAGEGIQVVSDAVIQNNVIFDCSYSGISAGPHAAVKEVGNARIVNNTIFNNPRGVRIRWGGAKGMVFLDNAVYCPGKTAIDAGGLEGAQVSGNCVDGSMRGAQIDGKRFIKGPNALVTDNDFRLDGIVMIVSSSAELRSCLSRARAGSVILLKGGSYTGGIYVNGLSGTKTKPIVIKGMDPTNPPVFSGGGGQAFHLSDCNHVVLANLVVKGFASNGINIDDGGTFETPSTYITLDNVSIFETGPTGNHDALKMSGVDHFVVRRCRFEGWGGSGIDMVGCHEGVVRECVFVGRKSFSQSNGVQMKGASRGVLVERCLFRDAGQRSINCGGSTGLAYFRPRVGDFEAKDITIAGNRFVGSMSPVAWVTSDGGHVHHNTILFPDKWVLRILQETRDKRFGACHDGVFEENVIIYDSRVSVFVNVGTGTAPGTFSFRRNAWCAVGDGRKPVLPTVEVDGIYRVPVARDRINRLTGEVHISDPRVRQMGTDGYRP